MTVHRATVATAVMLLGICALALLLRFAGLGWGRPWVYHPDEWRIADPAIEMVRSGSWDPNAFAYPSGLIFVERFLVAIVHLLQPGITLQASFIAPTAQFPFFYAGRAFVAVCGTAMILPVFLVARSISGVAGGLVAAIVVAVSPLAVTHSHYLTTDVPSAALVAVTLWLSLRDGAGARRWLVAAGFAAGLAASTKYNCGLVVVVPLTVLLASGAPRTWLRRPTLVTAALVTLASMAGFVLLTPAALLDPVRVWNEGIMYQVQAYAGGHPGSEGSFNAGHYLEVLWSSGGLGVGLAILSGLGLLVAIGRRGRADLAILVFCGAYFALISLPPTRFDRNLLPLVPGLAVLAGVGFGRLLEVAAAHLPRPTLEGRRRLAAAGAVAVILVAAAPSLSASVAQDQMFRAEDTRTTALGWIRRNLPAGTSIARELFTPQVPQPPYKVTFVNPLATRDLDWYRCRGVEYVVTSSTLFDRYSSAYPREAGFYRELLAEPIVLDLRPKPGQPGPRIVVVELGPPHGACPS